MYSKFVKPAFEDFILPTKKYADIIIPRGGDNHVAIDLIVQHICTKLGSVYSGVDFCKRLCGVSVIRSGESMENALRACCKGIKLGKILIHREGENDQQIREATLRHFGKARAFAGPYPRDMKLGGASDKAPDKFPRIKIVTSEIEMGLNDKFRVVPGMGEFGDRYFGTDDE
ncbi:unnamed protein product [Eruca vesicaria subsp. sativa]|uniref:Uncharacterized protein n=1 Tax=Eruca vesicaria subsp. sativa TaxID=29727 RepID=A0ABC8LRV5_ERUVS|nr:unnamed protein product [Eruca vesicaria subsp. sativa]